MTVDSNGEKMNKKNAWKLPRIGQKVEITIESVAFGGSGIGRFAGLVIFVPFTVDGDRVEIEITEVRQSYAKGRMCRILKPSPFRTVPECSLYERCGGCQYQHIAYTHQLEIKKNQVIDAFERIGKHPAPPVRDVIASPMPYAYRGKAEFHISFKSGRLPVIGYKEAADSRIVPVSRCAIVDESVNRSLTALRGKLNAISAAGRRGGKKEERVILWSDTGKAAVDPGVSGGRGGLVMRPVKEKMLRAPVQGFFQANSALVGSMVDSVIRACALTGKETVLDAYCGSGLFSLFLTSSARQLFGVDADGEAVHCAAENLSKEGISNAEFFAGDVGEILRHTFLKTQQSVDIVVLDPPRIGCSSDVLEALKSLGPARIIYISCNPATQARDVRRLRDSGYILRDLQPLDMFPQTKHIEIVGLLERENRI